MNWWASTGSGSRWTGPSPSPPASRAARSSGGPGKGAPEQAVGPSPVDRGKPGTKRSLLTDAAGIPLGVAVAGANRNDHLLVRETLTCLPVRRPEPTEARPQGLCLDQGYDFDSVRDLLAQFGFTLHIRARGEEARALKREAGERARRWVVERAHSWMNRFRRILIRWEKKAVNYLGLLHLVCAYITFKRAGLLG